MNEVAHIIETLKLQPHLEGGYFKEVYRSRGSIPGDVLPEAYEGDRNYATSIYFLLTSDKFSAFHRINQDETWHFYKGSSLIIHMIDASGVYSNAVLGSDLNKNQYLQFTVPGEVWFAAEVVEENSFALVGCTVAPGFDFKDFDLADRADLIDVFPQHKEIIRNFTRVQS